MSFVTFYAKPLSACSWVDVIYTLFADDIRILLLPKEADTTMDILTIIAMTLYLIELVLGVLAIENYFLSFYFWVDLVSLISMFPDISFVMVAFEDSIGGSGD